MSRRTLVRMTVFLVCTAIGAGTALPQNDGAAPPAGSAGQNEPLIELKIRRARWNIGLETLRTGPAAAGAPQDVKVAIGPAEPDLVSKQIVSVSCGGTPTKSAEFDAGGGIVTCTLDSGPADVKVAIAVEFVTSAGLASTTKTVEKHIAGEGLLVLYQAFSDTTNLFIDRGTTVGYDDYIIADLEILPAGKAQPQRQVLLSFVDGRPASRKAVFNILAGDGDPELRLILSGRLQGYWPAQLASIEPKAIRRTTSLSPRWDPYACRFVLAPTP